MGNELSGKGPRRIACTRCRARKKRCDHDVPTCGECKKSGSECVQYGTRRSGSYATVPIAYLQQLESQLSRARSGQRTDIERPDEPSGEPDCDGGAVFDGENDYPSTFVNAENQQELSGYPEGESADAHAASNDIRLEYHVDPSLGSYRTLPDMQHGHSEPATPFSSASDLRPRTRSPVELATGVSILVGRDAVLSIGEDWLDHYAHTYFRHVQPQWLFVDEQAWQESYAAWKRTPKEAMPSHKFLVQLVLAVGALVSSSFRTDCPHLLHASKIYEDAIHSHVGQVTGNPSALVRTQAALLMLLYALHGHSVDSISESVLLVLTNSANLIADVQDGPSQDDLCQDFEQTRKLTLMSAHVLNELVASAWTYTQTFIFDVLDEKVHAPALSKLLSSVALLT